MAPLDNELTLPNLQTNIRKITVLLKLYNRTVAFDGNI